MKAELQRKIIEILGKHANIVQNKNKLKCYWYETGIEKVVNEITEYAQSYIDHSVRLCSCSEEDYIGFTSINCCNNCGQPQEEFWINKQDSNTDSDLELCNHENTTFIPGVGFPFEVCANCGASV